MPRPKKNATVENTEVKQETKTVDDGFITLKHFVKNGRLFIDGEAYNIVDGVVKVKPEHALKAKEHIKLGG